MSQSKLLWLQIFQQLILQFQKRLAFSFAFSYPHPLSLPYIYIEPKSVKSERVIPIPQDLLEALKKCRSRGYIVISVSNKNISPRTFTSKRYDVFFKETGLRKLTPKQMRSTCGTLLYEKCQDIYAVKAFLGHSDIKVTSNIYVQPNSEDLRKQLFLEPKTEK